MDPSSKSGFKPFAATSASLPWIACILIVGLVAGIRLRLLEIPLERDEGEFAYMGQLMLQGIPPYLQAYSMKLPGIYAAYALLMAVFGRTVSGIHLGLLCVNAGSTVLLFLLTRRLFDPVAAVLAAAVFAVLSLSPSVYGTAGHATQFLVPFVLGGTLLLLKAVDSGKYGPVAISGLLFGLAFTMKQHAIFFVAFAVVFYAGSLLRTCPPQSGKLFYGTGLLLAASGAPFAIACVALYAAGVFPTFWFWTFTYARQYASQVPLSEALQSLIVLAPMAIHPWGWIWASAGAGLTAVFWNGTARSNRFFLAGFALFSFLTVCPGFIFRNHYFAAMLPAVAMLSGIGTRAGVEFLSGKTGHGLLRSTPVLLVAAAVIFPTIGLGHFFFRASPLEACRALYGVNPFPASAEIGKYIQDHSSEGDTVAVLGSEPQIYFHANRRSATGFLYVYGLMEPQAFASKMQLDMIREIEAAKPRYAVVVNIHTSWLTRPDSDRTFHRWAQAYVNRNYRVAGVVEIFPDGRHTAHWDDEARRYQPGSPFVIYVMERPPKAKRPA
ncbi:MAG: glycosyltransferase family 39 protein [Deltaproteobacteria bacterium]|nr:glycosyltransferase family 39 protein [Deltaproteobacteria bacterium]